jgi:uncharacterized protein YoxC
MAKLEQRVDDLRGDVKELSPLSLAVARMEGTVDRVKDDMHELGERLETFEQALEARIAEVAALVQEDKAQRDKREKDEQARRVEERREARRSRYALIIGCLAAILTPTGAIIAALIAG